jgi:hypothetical protein
LVDSDVHTAVVEGLGSLSTIFLDEGVQCRAEARARVINWCLRIYIQSTAIQLDPDSALHLYPKAFALHGSA